MVAKRCVDPIAISDFQIRLLLLLAGATEFQLSEHLQHLASGLRMRFWLQMKQRAKQMVKDRDCLKAKMEGLLARRL